MCALYQVGRRDSHVVTQIVETKLVVGTECDICLISLTTSLRVRLVLVDTINAQTVEHIERTHPLRVTLCQIVVHCYYVNTVTCQRIQEYRQGSHKCLTLTSCHLGYLTLMQNNTTKQLNIVVNHFPLQVVTTCSPVVVVDCLIAINSDEVLLWIASKLAVEVGSCYNCLLVLSKAAGCLFYDSEYLGHYLVQSVLVNLQHFLLNLIDLCEYVGTLVDRSVLDCSLQLFDTSLLLLGRVLYLQLQCFCTLTQCVVIQLLHLGINGLNLLYEWLDEFHVA